MNICGLINEDSPDSKNLSVLEKLPNNQVKMYRMISPIAKTVSLLWARPIFKDITTTTFFTIIGRSFGFLIPFFIAAWYGVGSATDAFFFAYGIIFFLTSIFSNVVSALVVPFVADVKAKGEDQGRFLGSILMGSGLGMIVISLIFVASGYPTFSLITGFSDSQLKLAYILSLETLPIVFLVVWSSLLSGVLNAQQTFGGPQLSFGARSIITLLLIFLLQRFLGIHAIPVGYILGEGFRTLYLFRLLAKIKDVAIKLVLPEKDALNFFKAASVQVIGVTVLSLFPVIDRTVASWGGVGGVSLLSYAEKLFLLPVSLVGEGLLIVLLSYWSKQTYDGQPKKLKSDVVKAVFQILYFSVPLGIILFLFRYEYTHIFYNWGSFPRDRITELSQLVGMYIIGLPPYLAALLFARGLLVLKDTLSLTKIAVWMLLLKVLFNLVFYAKLGLFGIVLSTSMVYVLAAPITWFYFNKRVILNR
jgi:putative peptidoglycan lipid II flippase